MNKEIKIEQLDFPVFQTWDSGWFVLTSGDWNNKSFNVMTVSWGSLGCMWNLPIAMAVVRPTRYTYEFINRYDNFTLCAFPSKYRKALNLLGTKSGRDGDKISESGLTPCAAIKVTSPIFEEAELTIECRKLYWQDILPEHFLDENIHTHYPENDYHRMFLGEILSVSGDAEKYTRH
jgi:flavin reductase (DIM6/NTAB) family NADH-FMN oxidoreductase RutF